MAAQLIVAERFWTKVDFNGPAPAYQPELGPCWLWRGGISGGGARGGGGYGSFYIPHLSRNVGAHRYAYEFCVGLIPEGLQIDHLCRVRNCVYPWHMEPVTQQENISRGEGGSLHRGKTHCLYGHPFSSANTLVGRNEWRWCRTCTARRGREYRARKRQLVEAV